MKRIPFYLLFFIGLGSMGFSTAPRLPNVKIQTAETPDEANLCLLRPPNQVNILVVAATWVQIQWDAVEGATHYRVKLIKSPSEEVCRNQIVAAKPGPFNDFVIDGLCSSPSYYVRVYSICSNGVASQ